MPGELVTAQLDRHQPPSGDPRYCRGGEPDGASGSSLALITRVVRDRRHSDQLARGSQLPFSR
jgi:hypothetical protein